MISLTVHFDGWTWAIIGAGFAVYVALQMATIYYNRALLRLRKERR